MTILKLTFGGILLSFRLYSQELKSTYEYRTSYYHETLNLFHDGSFRYFVTQELSHEEIKGNWQFRNDSILVLDSSPQKSKMLVFENQKKGDEITFRVQNMSKQDIHFNLYLITETNDTLLFRDQYKKTITNKRFSSFYIIDVNSNKSPTYKREGLRSNIFDIMLATERVFDNEHWKYYNDYIIPIGIDGEYSNYKLIKQ